MKAWNISDRFTPPRNMKMMNTIFTYTVLYSARLWSLVANPPVDMVDIP